MLSFYAKALEAFADLAPSTLVYDRLALFREQLALTADVLREDARAMLRERFADTMTVGWIAELLAMGTRGYFNYLLYRRRKLGKEYPISRTDPFSDPFTETFALGLRRFTPDGSSATGTGTDCLDC